MVACLNKSDASKGFNQVIDFLNGSYIKYTLTVNPDIYVSCIKQFWNTIVIKQTNDVTRLQALVDKKKVVVTESAIREVLRLDDAEGVDCLPNEEIFAELARMGDAAQEPSIPSPTPPTPPTQQPQDLPSTSQVQHTPPQSPQPQPQPQPQAQQQAADFPKSLFQKAFDACAALSRRVEHLKYDKVAQALEITKLKSKVKRLEKEKKVRVLKLRRLKKVGTSRRIDTSKDTVMEDASNQGRMIDDLDKDDDVTLMDDKKEEKKEEEAKEVVDVVTTAKLIKEVVTVASETFTATSITIFAAEPDPEEESSTVIPANTKYKDKGKGIMVEEPKPLKKKQHVEMDENYARKLHVELNKDIDWDVAIEHVKQKAKEDPAVQRYQVMKKMPQTEARARKNIIMYLKNIAGFRLDYFKGISYDDIRPIFEAKFNSNIEFLLMTKEHMKEEEIRALQSINETPAQKAAKRRKLNEEVEDLKRRKLNEMWSLNILDYFKGMSYDDIRPIFESKFNSNIEFLLKTKEQMKEEESRALQSINETPTQKASKRRKLNEEVEDLKRNLEIVPDEDDDIYTEATPLARKIPHKLQENTKFPLSGFGSYPSSKAKEDKSQRLSKLSIFLLLISNGTQKLVQALKDPSWVEAMQDELLQFKLLNVWTLVDLPKDKWAIGTKWVFRNKKDERGIVIKNKARLVAQGHTQEKGIDYDEVFAPIARIEAIRLFMAYASFKDFVVYQIDAPRAWYETLSTYLMDNGFHKGQIDKTMFIKRHKDDIMLVQVYVDDIIFGLTKKELSTEFETLMQDKFHMGELSFFLGLQVQQKSDGIFISQDKYVADILKFFSFSIVKTASTPIEPNKALSKMQKLKIFQVTPKTSHLHAMKGIFRYLKGQPKLGLWYPRDSPFDLEAYFDSDYTRASLDKKSTMGEYVAAASCCGQVLLIQNQMLDYRFNLKKTKIYIDNESTICIVKNPVFHSKTKNIEIRHHFIRDSYEKKLIQTTAKVKKINDQEQIQALVNKQKVIITEESIRHDLKFDDAEDKQVEGMAKHKEIYVMSSHAKKIFANMRRQGLQQQVLDLEEAKIAQAKEIAKLKKRVKKLEKRRKSRPAGLRRLKKVGTSKQVESSEKKDSLGAQEDASKQERNIEDIDQDAEIALVDEAQGRMHDAEMFGVDDLERNEVFVDVREKTVEKKVSIADPVTTAGEVVTAASVKDSAAPTTATTVNVDDKLTLVKTLFAIKASKPKVISTAITKPKAKGIVFHEQKDQIALDEEVARKLEAVMRAEIEEEKRIAREKDGANIVVIEEWDDVHATIDVDRQLAEQIQAQKREQEGKKSYFKIIRADGNSQNYLTFRTMLKNSNKEDLEVLSSLVKERFKKTKSFEVTFGEDICKLMRSGYEASAIAEALSQSIVVGEFLVRMISSTKTSRHRKISSVRSPCKKALLMSSGAIGQLLCIAVAERALTVTILATGAKSCSMVGSLEDLLEVLLGGGIGCEGRFEVVVLVKGLELGVVFDVLDGVGFVLVVVELEGVFSATKVLKVNDVETFTEVTMSNPLIETLEITVWPFGSVTWIGGLQVLVFNRPILIPKTMLILDEPLGYPSISKEALNLNLIRTSESEYSVEKSESDFHLNLRNPTTATEKVFETYTNVKEEIRDQLNAKAKACKVTNHQVNVQFLLQLQPEWQRFVTLVKQSQELKHVSYHKLYDILKQHQHEVNEIRAEKVARVANPLALVAQQQQVYHRQTHPTHYNQHSLTRTHQAATRNRGKALVNSPQPTYDQEPFMVDDDDETSKEKEIDKLMALISLSSPQSIYDQQPSMVDDDDETSKEKEIDKLMALISLSFKKIYKPTNNNLRTSSNTSRANQDNSPRIHRNVGYEGQRSGTVARARETVELEAHYMYMAKIQEVSPDAVDSRPIFDTEPEQKVQNDDYYDVFAIECQHTEQFKSAHNTYILEQDAQNVSIESVDMNYDSEQIDQNDEDVDRAKERELLASLI
nr:hypothetical protein [Tanacetum cinerariifolium]